ncbi:MULTISPECIES: hypothetical protein [Pseudomonas]|uniref:Lipoprotein n=1 Tax=Pseudomonas rustica TaxID=2827099 RepID=A0ABS5N3V6_9PSED|nr:MULTISPECIES: hypothetical protein [Pseudomonas]MBS4080462.1 hypothetical protein [Pseudomonas rustica]
MRLMHLVLWTALLALSACVTSVDHWSKPGATQATIDHDKAECQYQAKSATASYSSAPSDKSMSAAVGAGVGDGIVVAEKQIDLTNDCMRLRGYSGS